MAIQVKTLDGTVAAEASDLAGAMVLMGALYARTGGHFVIDGEGWINPSTGFPDPTTVPQGAPPPPAFGLVAQIEPLDASIYNFVVVNATVDTEIDFGDGELTTILADGDPAFIHAYADAGTYRVTATSGPDFAEVYVNPGSAPVGP